MAALGLAILWEPSGYVPQLFGIGGAIILVSYFGILWLWTRTYQAYEGIARTGKHVQLLGYSFLVITGCLLCLYFGYPAELALADLPIPNSLSINIFEPRNAADSLWSILDCEKAALSNNTGM